MGPDPKGGYPALADASAPTRGPPARCSCGADLRGHRAKFGPCRKAGAAGTRESAEETSVADRRPGAGRLRHEWAYNRESRVRALLPAAGCRSGVQGMSRQSTPEESAPYVLSTAAPWSPRLRRTRMPARCNHLRRAPGQAEYAPEGEHTTYAFGDRAVWRNQEQDEITVSGNRSSSRGIVSYLVRATDAPSLSFRAEFRMLTRPQVEELRSAAPGPRK